MKHIKETQLKRSVILSPEEFEYAVEEATGKNIKPQFDMDGLWFDYDYEEEDDKQIEDIDDYVKGCLSKYFEINITSIHIDDCDLTGVWLTFDKDLSLVEEVNKEGLEGLKNEEALEEDSIDNEIEM